MSRKSLRRFSSIIMIHFVILIVLNSGVLGFLHITGLVESRGGYISVMAAVIALSVLIIYLNAVRMKKTLHAFDTFFQRGKTPGNRINTEALNFQEAVHLADRANAMMAEWERERREYSDSEARYRDIVQNVTTGIIEYNQEGDVLFYNDYAEKIFGFPAEEMIGSSSIGKLNPEEDSTGLKHRDLLKSIFANPDAYAYNENENRTKDGRNIWVAWRNRIIYDSEGNKRSILCLANDITEEKKNRELLQKSLAEKETLLREIHHRIKNNLQIIASILNLQKSYPNIGKDVLTDCENRVVAISIVHEQLFESANLSTIESDWYIRSLVEHIIESHTGDIYTIKTDIEAERIELDIDTAIPLGLIINEMVTNAIKHGFNSNKDDLLSVSLEQAEDRIRLRVHDNGRGVDETFNPEEASGLGLKLVTSLVDQLDGNISYNSSEGLEWIVSFPFEKGRQVLKNTER